jgi:flagellar motor component MotA
MGYFGPEAMFVLSLPQEGQESLYDLIEDALQLRNSGLSTEEIEKELEADLSRLEDATHTPRMIRRIVLGDLPAPEVTDG